MLDLVKLALRKTTETFDAEIEMLIQSAQTDLENAGIMAMEDDPMIQQAIIEYCKWKFGFNDDAERWEHIYNETKGKLMITDGYTRWG